MLKYPCLVLDHDDTVVQSEATVNYPYFRDILDVFRPGATISLAEYTDGCFRLGFLDGKEGYIYHYLECDWYRTLVDAKIKEYQLTGVKPAKLTSLN